MMTWGWMPFHGVFSLVLLVALVAGVVLVFRSAEQRPPRSPSALDALNARYAKGEIGRDEYLQKKADIGT